MNHSKPTTIFLVAFAGYEIRLEMPRWVEELVQSSKFKVQNHGSKLKVNRELETRSYKLEARRDFFASVWDGLGGGHESASLAARRANLRSYQATNLGYGTEVLQLASLPLQIRPSRKLEAWISMVLGMVLVGLAVALGVGVFGPIVGVEGKRLWDRWSMSQLPELERQEAVAAAQVTFADYVAKDEVLATVVPESREFGVIIPKIGVNSRVVPGIDAANGKEYSQALKQGLAHAKGTALPGEKGDTFIFGHSTDYAWNAVRWNALFYNLKDLEKGDKVYVYYQGKLKIYQVTEKQVREPKDVSWLQPSSGVERLVLQTCTPPGTTWKRLVVFAQPLAEFTQLK